MTYNVRKDILQQTGRHIICLISQSVSSVLFTSKTYLSHLVAAAAVVDVAAAELVSVAAVVAALDEVALGRLPLPL